MRTKQEEEILGDAPIHSDFYITHSLTGDFLGYGRIGDKEKAFNLYRSLRDLRDKEPYKEQLTVWKAKYLGITFVAGDVRSSFTSKQGTVTMGTKWAEGTNLGVACDNEKVLEFAWRGTPLPEVFSFKIERKGSLWRPKLDQTSNTNKEENNVANEAQELSEDFINTFLEGCDNLGMTPEQVIKKMQEAKEVQEEPSEFTVTWIDGGIKTEYSESFNSILNEVFDNHKNEPKTKKWYKGEELEVGMICKYIGLEEEYEYKVTAIGRDKVLVSNQMGDGSWSHEDTWFFRHNIVPFQTEEELALEKQVDKVSEFMDNNSGMKQVDLVKAMQEAGLLYKIEEN